MAITMTRWTKWTFPGGDTWTKWMKLSDSLVADVQDVPGAYVVGLPPLLLAVSAASLGTTRTRSSTLVSPVDFIRDLTTYSAARARRVSAVT